MFRPSKPCSYLLLVVCFRYVVQLVESTHLLAKVLLYALSDQLLIAVELISHVIKCTSMTVVSVDRNREYLPVVLYLQLQFVLDVRLHETKEKLPELVLTRMIEHEIVRIFVTVYPVDLVYTVHEVSHCQVRKILRKIVPDWKTFSAVYDFVKKPQKVFVLYLPADDTLQNLMVHRRIELLYVYLQTVQRLAMIFAYHLLDIPCTPFNTTLLDTGISVVSEHACPYRFKNVHDCMVYNPVRKIGKAVYYAFLRLVNREHIILRSPEGLVLQCFMELLYVSFTVTVVDTNPIGASFALAGLLVSQHEVFYRYHLFI